MPIENVNGATVITGQGIGLFQLLSLKGRVSLEGKGLKSRVNATAVLMQRYGIPGKATAKNRALALAKVEEEIRTVGAAVQAGA